MARNAACAAIDKIIQNDRPWIMPRKVAAATLAPVLAANKFCRCEYTVGGESSGSTCQEFVSFYWDFVSY